MTSVPASSIRPPATEPASATATVERSGRPTVVGRTVARAPGAAPVHLTAVALFVGIGVLLTGRMLAGEDPALGLTVHPPAAPAPTAVLRKVVVTRRMRIDGLSAAQIRRRGIDRIVVVRRRVSAAPTTAAGGGDSGPAPARAVAAAGSGATVSSPRARGSSGDASAPTADAVTTTAPPSPADQTPAPAETATAPPPAETAPAPTPVAAPVAAPAPPPVATTTS